MYSSFKTKQNKVNGLSPLDRKTPRNSKYANVKSQVDTGSSMSKVELITARQYLLRRDELFKRVSPTTCRELIDEHNDQTETIFELGRGDEEDGEEDGVAMMGGGSVMGGGAAAAAAPLSPSAEPRIASINAEDYVGGVYNESIQRPPFLILDVREKKEYNQCHIKGAQSYPANNLRHDIITPDLYYYKNKDGHVIVVYDLDDRMARNVATMFTEKGYENIFLMTGGMERFSVLHSALLVGKLPEVEGKENKMKKKGNGARGGKPPRPEYTAKVGQTQAGGRPPRNPRSGSNKLTTANVQANERAHRTGGTPNKRDRSRGQAPSLAGSTQSRAESLLSWNAGKGQETRHSKTSLM
jgi:centrosomal protein CEP41